MLVMSGFTITVGNLSPPQRQQNLTCTNIHTETDYDPKGYKHRQSKTHQQRPSRLRTLSKRVSYHEPKVTQKQRQSVTDQIAQTHKCIIF